MKTKLAFSSFLLLVFAFFTTSAVLADKGEREGADTSKFVSYHGKVIDAQNGNVLPFATIEAVESNVATVSNIDGEFTLKIGKDTNPKHLKFSYVGYSNTSVSFDDFNKENELVIRLYPSSIQMKAVTIRPENAASLMDNVIKNINKNYPNKPVMMKAFYRETIKNRRNYVSISEAVVDIFKSEYNNDLQIDRVKIDKGRKSADVEKMDTVLFKLQGGPAVSLLLDVVKNPYILLTSEYKEIYDFYITDVVNLNDMLHYVVSFDQKKGITAPFYNGKFFVEMESLAITQAEFELNLENTEEAERIFIQRKPAGMHVIPEKAIYRTKYSIHNDTWYFSYARAEVKFKVDWEKKWFNTKYTTMSEIAITERKPGAIEKIQNRERFKRNDILDEMVYTYFDADYWGDYNVIEPDQSIETAIRKLNRKFNVELSD